MHPELFRIGPLVVNSYGVLLALSFVLGILLTLRKGEKRGLQGNDVINLSLIIMASSIIGARLFYVLFHLNDFRGRWWYTFIPLQADGTVGLGGMVFLGGFLLAAVAGSIYIYFRKISFWKFADSISPAIALGIFITRIGCFLNGCCFGKVCSKPWAVSFSPHSPAGYVMGNTPVHPTQLYSSLYGLLIFTTLMALERNPHFKGFLFGIFLILYGISRFIVDFFRYYENQMFIALGLELNQIISLGMFLMGIIILVLKRSRNTDTVSHH